LTKIKLYCDDCLKVLPKIKTKSVDVCVFSPPYNLGTKYSHYQDNLTEAEYLDFIYKTSQRIYHCLKPQGSLFINIGGSLLKPQLPFRVASLLAGNLFKLQNVIIWVKSIAIKGKTYGHFTPINSPRFINNNFEFVFHFTKTGRVKLDRLAIGVPFTDKTNIKRFKHKVDRRCLGNVWWIPYPTKQKKSRHPATYPIRLPLHCIKLHGKPRAVVLDPFCGTGATGIAAIKFGAKRFIGIDIDPNYIKLAKRRLRRRVIKPRVK
jgi:site-specific DNA-methyltransferase (adenine-specific)